IGLLGTVVRRDHSSHPHACASAHTEAQRKSIELLEPMRARLAALVTLIAAASVFPQQQPPLVESIEVRIANIDVVVRDRSGHPVTGLTKDDFQLFDGGKPQTITNFYEVQRGESAPDQPGSESDVPLEVRQRRILVFVDSASLTPARKKAVLNALG